MSVQPDLFTGTRPTFKGRTFSKEQDQVRLETALGRIRDALAAGGSFTLRELAEIGRCSEAGASARVRDCRRPKEKGGLGMRIQSSRVKGGLWRYEVIR